LNIALRRGGKKGKKKRGKRHQSAHAYSFIYASLVERKKRKRVKEVPISPGARQRKKKGSTSTTPLFVTSIASGKGDSVYEMERGRKGEEILFHSHLSSAT